jgi:arginase
MSSIVLIAWPYHSGLADVSMGLGASTLTADQRLLSMVGGEVQHLSVERVVPVDESLPEIARTFELVRRLARHVAQARRRGDFPLVFGGNCVSCLGTTAGARDEQDLGVVWLDAHADFDTPEDNLSGFTDVMGLSILTGGCWRALRETIPGFTAVSEEHVVLIGTRELEDYQRRRLAGSRLSVVGDTVDPGGLRDALDGLRARVARIYLHVDLDVLDASVGVANPYAAAGGPALDQVLGAITDTFGRFEVACAALTAYDPRVDHTGAIADAAREISRHVTRLAARQIDRV